MRWPMGTSPADVRGGRGVGSVGIASEMPGPMGTKPPPMAAPPAELRPTPWVLSADDAWSSSCGAHGGGAAQPQVEWRGKSAWMEHIAV